MLFTDGVISTIEELSLQDTAILEVASAEGINLTAKLALAQDELGIELKAAIARSSLSSADYWSGDRVAAANQCSLQDVVVTPALHLWHTFRTLALIYRDAYNSQLNDRYLGKWRQYRELASWAADKLFLSGIGTVTDPLPIAGPPQLSLQSGTMEGMTYYVQVSWVNTRREEGMPSSVISIEAPDQTTLLVTAPPAPSQQIFWNIYAGDNSAAVTLQNAVPLELTQTWTAPPYGLVIGRPPGAGQDPNYFRSLARVLHRG